MYNYIVKRNEVAYLDYDENELVLEDVDLATFEILEDKTLTESDLEELRGKYNRYALGKSRWVAKDKNNVWTKEVKIPGADPETFEFFLGGQCMWGQDKNGGYCLYSEGKNRIKNITLNGSLQFFKEDRLGAYMRMYAYDDKYIYYYGRRCKGSRSDDCRYLVEESVHVDVLSGVKYDDRYCIASNGIVFYRGRVLPEADAATARSFSIDEPGRGSLYITLDKNTIYYGGKPFTSEINPAMYKRIPSVLFELQESLKHGK